MAAPASASAPAAACAPHRTLLALAFMCLLPCAYAQAIQDGRCYLMNGGAVESFFISEDTPVGSVIGTLSVNGDPSPSGDISLRLQERGAAVAVGVAPGTKNLTLLRALDREDRLGPSNVYVNVRCDRRGTTDPSFIIPVSVRVWDVNDNAPQWAGAPYRARLSELTAAGARVLLAARATDADQPGPHATVRYSVLPGPHSEHFTFPNELDSALILNKPLDYESARNFTVWLRAADGGRPPLYSDAALHVTVLDADDQNPKFEHDHYSAVLPEHATEGAVLETQPGRIAARDQDSGIDAPLQYAATGDLRHLVAVDRDSGAVAVTRALLRDADLPATVVIKATQVDNEDRYALATLTIRGRNGALRAGAGRAGGAAGPAAGAGAGSAGSGPGGEAGGAGGAAEGVRFSQRAYHVAVREDAPVGTILAALRTEPRVAGQKALQFYVSERSFLEKFAINGGGELLLRRALDYEAEPGYRYQVMVTDPGSGANDTASINITVLNVNEWEPRFRHPQYEFRAPPGVGAGVGAGAEDALVPLGRLEVFDGDRDDTVTITLRGSDAEALHVSPAGELWLRPAALRAPNASASAPASALHAVATAVDSGQPPRQTSVPLVVHVGAPPPAAGGTAGIVGVFGAALAALALLVLALLAYICRVKRSKASAAARGAGAGGAGAGGGGGFVAHEKGPAPPASPGAPRGPPAPPAPAPAPAGSLQSVSAGASTILANSSSSLDLRSLDPPNSARGRRAERPRGGGRGRGAGRGRGRPLGRGVAQRDHPRAGQEAQLGRRAPAQRQRRRGQRGGSGAARRDQPRRGGPHEPHRVLLTGGGPRAPPPALRHPHDSDTVAVRTNEDAYPHKASVGPLKSSVKTSTRKDRNKTESSADTIAQKNERILEPSTSQKQSHGKITRESSAIYPSLNSVEASEKNNPINSTSRLVKLTNFPHKNSRQLNDIKVQKLPQHFNRNAPVFYSTSANHNMISANISRPNLYGGSPETCYHYTTNPYHNNPTYGDPMHVTMNHTHALPPPLPLPETIPASNFWPSRSPRGPPPEYATIDPKRFGKRYIRPGVLMQKPKRYKHL